MTLNGPALAAALDATLASTGDLVARLHTIVERVPGRVAFSTSLGIEDQVVLHAISAADAAPGYHPAGPVDVFTLDTGRLFTETLDTLDASMRRYGVTIRMLSPAADDVEALVARDGVLGFRSSVEARKACCDVRKVRPLARALHGAAGWVTGLRRAQAQGRADVPFATWDAGLGILKFNPIADWSLEQVEAYVASHGIPINALHARGFPSIGCATCTRAVAPGEDIRAGRWWWESQDGKECGLHRPAGTGANTTTA